jgi:NAD(P)-dependent dehydrogenase (short-subunit alcohol dehydrogenase family)
MGAAIVTDEEHVLVTGATGLVGRAAVEHFTNAGYRTTAISQRQPFDAYGAEFLSVDLADRAACEAAFGGIRDCTRIVFAAVEDQPDLVAGWTATAPTGSCRRCNFTPSCCSRTGVHVRPRRQDIGQR